MCKRKWTVDTNEIWAIIRLKTEGLRRRTGKRLVHTGNRAREEGGGRLVGTLDCAQGKGRHALAGVQTHPRFQT